MGVATGCGCKEVYRFPHTTHPYSSCICSFLQQHSYFLFTVGRHLVSGLGCGFLFTSSQERKFTYYSEYLLESEREASNFSGETSSSFEFSLSNSAHSNEEELVSVDSTVEPYHFEPVRASTSQVLD